MNEYYHFYLLKTDFQNFKKGEILWHDVLNRTCHPVDRSGQEDVGRKFQISNLNTPLVKRINLPCDEYYKDGKFIVYEMI